MPSALQIKSHFLGDPMTLTSIAPSSQDIFRVILVNIDNEGDFVNKNGLLSVEGADLAAHRTARFIDTHLDRLTTILSSMDKHGLKHIFLASWWVNREGKHPAEYSQITYEDIQNKTWLPRFDKQWSVDYVRTLQKFTIWPVHCVAGTAGSEIVPVIAQAISRHGLLRRSVHLELLKGQNLRTEHYGIFGAEVEDPKDPGTKLNTGLMRDISGYNRSYWLGQEANHCVRRSLEQYIAWCEEFNPEAIHRMRYVTDCVSLLPLGPEYQTDADRSLFNMVQKGMLLVNSSDQFI